MILKALDKIDSLRFENLSFGYEDTSILEKVSFEFPMNDAFYFSGRPGCGKTTLLKLLAGLNPPTSGEVFINEQPMSEFSFEEFLPYRIKIGYSADMGGLLSNRTIRENILLAVAYHKSDKLKEYSAYVDHLIEEFGLTAHANFRPSSVTGSVRRATVVARSFALKPEMLILDDPTHGLSRDSVTALIQAIKEGRQEGWLRHVYMCVNDEFVRSSLMAKEINVEKNKVEIVTEELPGLAV